MTLLLFGTASQVSAAQSFMGAPAQSGIIETSRGPAVITGNFGSLQTTTLPAAPGQGLLMNNGNGTSTLLTPGGLPQVVATPR
jgi:hypothetical protein